MSADGESICDVLAGTSEPSVVSSQVGVLSLGKVLAVAPGTPFKGVGSSWPELLCWKQIFSPVGRICLRYFHLPW